MIAGGKGRRTKEIFDIPKALLPIRGKPILEHAIAKYIDYRAIKVYVSFGESRC